MNELARLSEKGKKAIKHFVNEELYCLIVEGEGMSGARIKDGDIVFVKAQESVDNGDIAVINVNGKTMLSQVFYYPERQQMLLCPANSKFETFLFEGEDIDKVKFFGKVVACLNDFELHASRRTA